jgi:hypothetical protein
MIDGHADGGYTGRYEVICPACGDDPDLGYDQVPPELQKICNPCESLPSGLAALDVQHRARGHRARSSLGNVPTQVSRLPEGVHGSGKPFGEPEH